MFWTRVTTAIEEIKHFHWCPAENQLPVAQNGDFVKAGWTTDGVSI